MRKYLWKIEQAENLNYDTYDSAVVCAKTEEEARQIHPRGLGDWQSGTWASSPEKVTVTKVGTADKSIEVGTVVCASFNAG